jgi:hypothetical protein
MILLPLVAKIWSVAFIVRMANIRIISITKIKLASKEGQPFISGFVNRSTFITFLRSRKATQDTKTAMAKNSKIFMATPYAAPKNGAKILWLPVNPSMTNSKHFKIDDDKCYIYQQVEKCWSQFF